MNRKTQFILNYSICAILIGAFIIYCLSIATYVGPSFRPFRVELNLIERFICLSFLPAQAGFVNLRTIRDLQVELAPTAKEVRLAGLEDLSDGRVRADNWSAVKEKEIVFYEITRKYIVDALRNLKATGKLPQSYYTLYVKFVEDPERKGEL